jgi:hypothetical protein
MFFANFKKDEGSIVLEFIGFGIILQVPLLVLVLGLTGLQHDQLAAEAINRDALRSLVLLNRTPDETASEVAQLYRLNPSRVSLSFQCQNQDCDSVGNWVHLTTRIGQAVSEGEIIR